MSADTVDDLHEVEDAWGACTSLLADMLSAGLGNPDLNALWGRARQLVMDRATYCRPTCGADGDPTFEGCEEGDSCGCPCGHADA